jgi:ABC-2 type transport system permease protein
MYGSLMAGLGALAPDLKETRGLSFLVMSPMIVTYVFMMAIILRPEGLLALALSLFPLTSPIAMIGRMTVTEVPLWQPVLAAALQLLAVVLIVRLVARLFRARYLLSGQPLTIGRYYAALMGRA